MAVFFDLEWARPIPLDRIAQPMQRSDAGVATPREDELARTPGTDHLVVQKIGGHPDEGEIPQPLPDNLVSGCKRNQMRESFERDGVSRVNRTSDRLVQLEQLTHRLSPATAGRDKPNSRAAFSFRISGRTSSRIAVFSRSAIQRSGVIHG
jgi:hypothetical protein